MWSLQRGHPRLECSKTGFQTPDLSLGGLLASAGIGGKFLDGLQFLPPHEVEPLDQVVHPGTHHRLGFLAQSGEGGDRTAGHTGDVVEESGPIAHGSLLFDMSAFAAAVRHVYSAPMILITGGAGFIGSNLQAALVRRGHETVVADTLGSDGKWRNLAKHPPARVVHPNELHRFLDSHPPLEMVFHLGAVSETTAVDGDHTWATNVELSRRLWEWCADRDVRMVYASSAATYGDGRQGFDDEFSLPALDRLRPLNLYGWTKHAFDMLVAKTLVSRREQPPQWVGLKFFNVYGPNEYHKGKMISVVKVKHDEVAAGGPARLFKSDQPGLADGAQSRDFIWVGDVVDVMLWLMETPSVSGLFNLGTGRARTYLDLAHAVSAAAGQAPAVQFIDMPASLVGQYQSFTEAPMDRLRMAGYTGQFTPLEEGIRRYVQDHLAGPDLFV
jgi:ADP-L-glycero-D-manno-heptose 6-epimerase